MPKAPRGSEGGISASSPISHTTAVELTALRKLVAQAAELHDKNPSSSSSLLAGDRLRSRLADLERMSAGPTF